MIPEPQTLTAEGTRLPFWKMQGSGNDFILIDHRRPFIKEEECPALVRRLCQPKFGVGADGLILIEPAAWADFRWRFFNADGSEAEMCGNGGRCAARFAYLNGIAPASLTFETLAGLIQAEVKGRRVKLGLSQPRDLRLHLRIPLAERAWEGHFLNTGVPHVVLLVDELAAAPVAEVGRAIRFHELFQPAGTNVNFVRVSGPQELQIRTYERGVEAETLACGTGSVAAALIAARLFGLPSPVTVRPRSGEILTVHFTPQADSFAAVFLEGDAIAGELIVKAMKVKIVVCIRDKLLQRGGAIAPYERLEKLEVVRPGGGGEKRECGEREQADEDRHPFLHDHLLREHLHSIYAL